MKKLLTIIFMSAFISSCISNDWTETDKQQFLNDCKLTGNNSENIDEICNCGLQKAIENYKSKAEAEKAIQKMTQEEVEVFFAECL